MGGYLVNGCGASDSYYPIRNVGEFQCKGCGNKRVFALMQLKRKVRILYIPTVSLSVKYAIVCTSCRTGYYIEESVKDQILAGNAIPEVTKDGLLIHTLRVVEPETLEQNAGGHLDSTSSEEKASQKDEEEETKVETKVEAEVETVKETVEEPPSPAKIRFCVNCGSRLDEATGLCPVCSVREEEARKEQVNLEESADTEEIRDSEKMAYTDAGENSQNSKDDSDDSGSIRDVGQRRKVCPVCKLTFPAAKEKCTLCGRELMDQA